MTDATLRHRMHMARLVAAELRRDDLADEERAHLVEMHRYWLRAVTTRRSQLARGATPSPIPMPDPADHPAVLRAIASTAAQRAA